MKKLLFVIVPLVIGCNNYSPLDKWIETHNSKIEEDRKHRQSVSEYLDSLKVVSVPYFKDGQILLPSYACPDTLIVINKDGLNYGMGLIEQGLIDATDYQIDSILHTNCEVFYKP